MGLWDNIKDKDINEATSTKGGVYLKPGNYTVRINRCRELETRAKKTAFIAELEVVESDNAECPVGYQPSFFCQEDPRYPQMALGNIADLLRAALASMAADGTKPESIELSKELAMSVTGEENLLAGTFVRVYVYNKKTKEKGNDFTHHSWSIPENLAELTAAA